MPVVTMPDGKNVRFPDEMSPAEIKQIIVSKFPEAGQKSMGAPEAIWTGIKQGTTFGFGDELQAAIAAGVASTSPELTYEEAYEQAKQVFKEQQQQAAEQQPYAYYPGEIGGAMATGGLAASKIGGKALASQFAKAPIRTAAGTGAVSGGIYGTGASEGTIPQRLAHGGEAAALGLGTGAVGGYVAPKIAGGIRRLVKGKAPTQAAGETIEEVIEAADERAVAPKASFATESAAQEKIVSALKKDYPQDWERILGAWKESGKPLAELAGPRTASLAKGAAQYPSGKVVAERYFAEQVAEMPERIKESISRNISSVDNYYMTAEDLVKAGQKKARPLYEKAYKVGVIDDEGLNAMLGVPELKRALKEGVKIQKIEAAAEGLPFNPNKYALDEAGELLDKPSMELLDAGKKGLDALIEKEVDAITGKTTQYGKALIKLRKSYLGKIDDANPFYKEARKSAGDYLRVQDAMEKGKKFMKLDSELIARDFAKMTPVEKDAYKIGVGKQLRDLIDSPTGGVRNPYDKVFRGIEQQRKLSKILSPTEYKNFEKAIKAEDRLWKMKNEILGGSPTAAKQIAAQEIAASGADVAGFLATGDVSGASAGVMRGTIKKMFDGLSDNSADAVSRMLFERDPVKKLGIINSATSGKGVAKQERELIKKAFFVLDEAVKGQQQAAVASGVAAGQITKDEE